MMRRLGADVVMVTAHSGDSGMSSYQGDIPVENASAMVAEDVPGIDAVLFGHAHNEVPEKFVTNKATGRQVLLTESGKWGSRLSVVIYNAQVEIRQALIDYASAAGTIDPAAFFVPNWRLTREGEPVL